MVEEVTQWSYSFPQVSNIEDFLLFKGEGEHYCIPVTIPIAPPAPWPLNTIGQGNSR